ncbi:EPIDERMAL PATTERNING FACTOR-like protein 6 [Sesamum indicum]|uniref:Epidermal patterning factor-like protein n=1 Tax=Sesamum indicum TaxID=4182 RepID=A0A6I9TD66_SESIN|nr:EPIDERMAL PATTERNING FACTOR-like protein 6 [Sesamum indicum]
MGYCWRSSSTSGLKPCKTLRFYAVICCFCCFCLCVHGIYAMNSDPTSRSETRNMLSLQADNCFQNSERNKIRKMVIGVRGSTRGARRLLGGLGSSPPRCTSKCGECTPCKPVHVPVPPGTPVTTEYYPEAWRCKCGNKLYMP